MIPTPPYNLAYLSYNFSLSYSEVEFSISPVIYSTLDWISYLVPDPSITTVSSFPMIIFLDPPRILTSTVSQFIPNSGSNTSAEVNTAISSN